MKLICVSGTISTGQSEGAEDQRNAPSDVTSRFYPSAGTNTKVHKSSTATHSKTPMAFWDTVLNTTNVKSYGKRLVPSIVDDNARQQPDRACFSYPICYANLQHGFQDVSWRQVSVAIPRSRTTLTVDSLRMLSTGWPNPFAGTLD